MHAFICVYDLEIVSRDCDNTMWVCMNVRTDLRQIFVCVCVYDLESCRPGLQLPGVCAYICQCLFKNDVGKKYVSL